VGLRAEVDAMEKNLAPAENRTPVVQPVVKQTELSASKRIIDMKTA
jgi:hypothetical protein